MGDADQTSLTEIALKSSIKQRAQVHYEATHRLRSNRVWFSIVEATDERRSFSGCIYLQIQDIGFML